MSDTLQQSTKARVAFISGHIDLTQEAFDSAYKARLDEAIAAGDSFIVSSSRGADTLALNYLLASGVHGEKITVYLNIPLSPKTPAKGASSRKPGPSSATNRRDPAPAMIQRYEDRGMRVKMISGDHTKRDTVMTRESDYDILWVRPEEESRALYGKKFRAGRVSGTEKNRLRREVVAVGREAVGRKGIADPGDGDEGEGESG